MEYTETKRFNVRYIAELGLFVGVILLMKITGLSSIPIGPLVMTFTMIPIAIGAMLLGPLAGTVLGAFYGLLSLYDAITGKSLMTAAFFQVSPFLTVLLCVGTRALVGLCMGWFFKLFQKLDRRRIWSYFAGGLLAPLLNTLFFMGFIVLVFYRTEYVQNLASKKGAVNPIMFVVLVVGVQGLIEWATGLVIGGAVAKGVAAALKRYEPLSLFKTKTNVLKRCEPDAVPGTDDSEAPQSPEPEPTDEPKEE